MTKIPWCCLESVKHAHDRADAEGSSGSLRSHHCAMSDAHDHVRHLLGGRRRVVAALVAAAAVVSLAVGDIGDIGEFRASAAGETPQAIDVAASPTQMAVRGRVRREFPPPPAGKYVFPVDAASNCSVWRSSFGRAGSVSSSGFHEGTDIMGSAGRAVYAIADGVLTRRYVGTGTSGSGYGWTLTVAGTSTQIKFFHMAVDDLGWKVGDQVRVGDVLGYVGDTGTTVGNFHLHLEVRPNNVPIDPLPLLDIPAQCRVL